MRVAYYLFIFLFSKVNPFFNVKYIHKEGITALPAWKTRIQLMQLSTYWLRSEKGKTNRKSLTEPHFRYLPFTHIPYNNKYLQILKYDKLWFYFSIAYTYKIKKNLKCCLYDFTFIMYNTKPLAHIKPCFNLKEVVIWMWCSNYNPFT